LAFWKSWSWSLHTCTEYIRIRGAYLRLLHCWLFPSILQAFLLEEQTCHCNIPESSQKSKKMKILNNINLCIVSCLSERGTGGFDRDMVPIKVHLLSGNKIYEERTFPGARSPSHPPAYPLLEARYVFTLEFTITTSYKHKTISNELYATCLGG